MYDLAMRWRRTLAPLYARAKRAHDRCGPEQTSRKSWLARTLRRWEKACLMVYYGGLSLGIMLDMLDEANFVLLLLDASRIN
jgi:hypothetical protein